MRTLFQTDKEGLELEPIIKDNKIVIRVIEDGKVTGEAGLEANEAYLFRQKIQDLNNELYESEERNLSWIQRTIKKNSREKI